MSRVLWGMKVGSLNTEGAKRSAGDPKNVNVLRFGASVHLLRTLQDPICYISLIE